MAQELKISFDSDLLEAISADFDLRRPNKEALRQLIFTLDGGYDPEEQQVLNLATGVGKTYLMAAFMEYLRRQGIGNVVIVTPGKTVQSKTVQNFTPGSSKFIAGAAVPPDVVTPQDYGAWISRTNGAAMLSYGREVPILAFIFNIQQLIAPKDVEGDTRGGTQDAMRRKPRRFDENAGVLFDYLKDLDDLVVIADESHLYGSSAVAFNAALKELDPAAAIGLTASVNKKTDHVIFEYPLYRAIVERYVKKPVLAFRKDGYSKDASSEEQQLRDALQLRNIKQAYYNSYAESQRRKHVNAVVFVVCSDVEHATQVADLLKTPEFFGRDDAVLQVDSKHEDDTTQRLLNNLDQPDSPVLAVVSVNKLKEGWDVKNIAVIVTLRAMASEVLTQQTMGRGLRLPFGEYTGVGQIDQLDIVAHQSFQELLTAENVLEQFGLEEAVKVADKGKVESAIREAAEAAPAAGPSASTQPEATGGGFALQVAPVATNSQIATDYGVGGLAPDGKLGDSDFTANPDTSLGFRFLDEETQAGADDFVPEIISVERNPNFTDVAYKFPVTSIEISQPKIDLTEITDEQIEQAAKKVTSTGEVMYRKEIIASVGKGLRAADVESAEVNSLPIETEYAHNALVRQVINQGLVPKTAETAQYVKGYLVPKFMKHVTFDHWTIKSLSSATNLLQQLVKNYVAEALKQTREVPVVKPRSLPGDGFSLRLGQKIHDQVDSSSEYENNRYYGGWFKSLFEAESFDSYTGEFLLAKLLTTSPDIVWWHRLHSWDQAYVYYNSTQKYNPDFVAVDKDGVYWIIEGKSEKGRDDAVVAAKRRAAEQVVRKISSHTDFESQHWGYLIAFENDIQNSDSWGDLKAMTQPVSNVL